MRIKLPSGVGQFEFYDGDRRFLLWTAPKNTDPSIYDRYFHGARPEFVQGSVQLFELIAGSSGGPVIVATHVLSPTISFVTHTHDDYAAMLTNGFEVPQDETASAMMLLNHGLAELVTTQ